VLRGRSTAHLELLVQHGADVAARDAHGHPGLARGARRAKRRAGLARAHGQLPPQGLHERFLAACAAADEPRRAGLAGRASRPHRPAVARDLALLPEQAQRGALASVRLMLELGWPVDVPGPWKASALNQAAFRGDAAMVALLLQHGARWSRSNGYGGTALGSCLHAACNEPVAGGDYAEVLRLLLRDGAPLPEIDDHLTDEMREVVETMEAAR
jgi:hypothetical protein